MFKFKKTNYIPVPSREPQVPEGLWIKCSGCGEMLYKEDVVKNQYACYKCGKYFRLTTKKRLRMVADADSFTPWDVGMEIADPLDFPDYTKKVEELKERLPIDEAVTTGVCTIDGKQAVVCVCDGRFLMGSMGYVVGEKITRAVERATSQRLPVIIFTCSGGARMQEGIVSLMQMAKTAAALKKHSDAGLLYISVLTDPTTGGVTASFAMLGDIILAEPGALVGFAGPRVIEQTIGQKLPEGFQRAEFLLEHGFVDRIVRREELKETLAKLIALHEPGTDCSGRGQGQDSGSANQQEDVAQTQQETIRPSRQAATRPSQQVTAWERVQRARSAERPTSLDYIQRIFDGFLELHGDRRFGDDGAIVGGIAWFDGQPVTVIGQQKGKTTKENITRNFGMPSPEGYRKALRLMKQAQHFGRPIICFVDTPGAFCGMEAEERGQGEAIARNLFEMSELKVPVLSIVIGEGGSGGALAMAVGNEVWMLENAAYTILSPEGFAAILWKDAKLAPQAAEAMRITAQDLKELGVIEKIIPEETPADVLHMQELAACMKKEIAAFLFRYRDLPPEELAALRYQRFRRM